MTTKAKTVKKQVAVKLGTTVYYLGKLDGEKIWLQKASWDCNWYWGFGYVETYNSRGTDINSHQHFDGLFLKGGYDALLEMEECPLNATERWELLELMKTSYTLAEAAAVFGRGSSHMATNPAKSAIQDEGYAKRLNEKVLPAVFEKIYAILSPAETREEVEAPRERSSNYDHE